MNDDPIGPAVAAHRENKYEQFRERSQPPPVLARVLRGELLESEHRGHVVITDRRGSILFQAGDPDTRVFVRSAAKPIQSLPLIEDDLERRFGLDGHELALTCASHNGEPIHVEAGRALLRKMRIPLQALQCGKHRPLGVDLGSVQETSSYDVLQNNCSGKHIGMLGACRYHGWPVENYLARDHPQQARILDRISEFGELNRNEIAVCIDGCSAPAFNLPLRSAAISYAKLAENEFPANRCFDLISAHPEMIGGARRFDTDLMCAFGGRIVAKVGAEGVQCLSIRGKPNVGIALKVSDGSGRAVSAIVLALLRSLGFATESELDRIRAYANPELHNHRGLQVGRIECCFPF